MLSRVVSQQAPLMSRVWTAFRKLIPKSVLLLLPLQEELLQHHHREKKLSQVQEPAHPQGRSRELPGSRPRMRFCLMRTMAASLDRSHRQELAALQGRRPPRQRAARRPGDHHDPQERQGHPAGSCRRRLPFR